MTTIDVLADASTVVGRGEEAGRLRRMNCGRSLRGAPGEAAPNLDRATLSCPPGAPPALRVSATVVQCGRRGGRVMFEYE